MENYPSNSRRAPEDKKEPKKVEKIITGESVRRKKPLGRRFKETFVGGDDAGSVWGYVVNDVLVPAAKDMLSDAVSQGVERMLFGDIRSRSNRFRSSSGAPHTSYNRFSSPNTVIRREDPRREMSRRARSTHDFDEIVLATRREAEDVIQGLYELVTQFDAATVADLYELVGQSSNFTDAKWGWTDMRGASVSSIKGGYLLDLPPTIPLD